MDKQQLREKIIEIIASALSDNDVRPRADEILALISPLIEDAKKQEREKAMEEEAFNIQCCVSDARRVHPDWTIDDVEELLEFREKTRKAIQSQSGDFIPLEEVRQALKEGEKDG